MSLLEIIGEELDPGPMGDFTSEEPPRETRPRWLVILRAVVGLGMIATPFVIAAVGTPFSIGSVGLVAMGMVVYLGLAHFLRPRPDFSNMGWLGGAFDNPFRYSDDVNRFLLFLSIVLWPGRFATTSILDLFREPPRVDD